jgi:hypothetical protein
MKTPLRLLHWLPRIICILSILLISLFAADAFNPNETIWQQLGDFLGHLIPSIVLTSLLIVAWRWEFIGGITFIIIGILFSLFVFSHNYNKMNYSIANSLGTSLITAIPFTVGGILFIISHFAKKRSQSAG